MVWSILWVILVWAIEARAQSLETTLVSFNGQRGGERYWLGNVQSADNFLRLKATNNLIAAASLTVCLRFLLRYSSSAGFFKSKALAWQITRMDKRYGRVKINDRFSRLYDFGHLTPTPGQWYFEILFDLFLVISFTSVNTFHQYINHDIIHCPAPQIEVKDLKL